MAKEFPDRWGVPVRASSADAVALLDEAIEDLAGLAGDPLADPQLLSDPARIWLVLQAGVPVAGQALLNPPPC